MVLTFSFDDELLSNGDLDVLRFDNPSVEWANFILKNRMEKKYRHEYVQSQN